MAERRTRIDRRRITLRTFAFGLIYSRRRKGRRGEESPELYLDWFDARFLFISVSIFILSCMDAAFTLHLLQLGAIEANPIMAVALTKGPMFFLVSKMALTAFGLFFLVSLGNFSLLRKFKVNALLYFCLIGYLSLIAYELALLKTIPA